MAAYVDDGVEDSLETRLNKATNPLMLEENWEHIVGFCDMVNKDVDGPQMAVRLLVHKIQSPQEKESLFALTVLEACVKNCGTRFQQEVGKFRFINEIIKVISPKYLGNQMSLKVKNKCIILLYVWSQSLSHEPKIKEAYTMLKRQGVVKEDPDIFSTGCNVQEIIRPQPSPPTPPPPPPVPKKNNSVFEDEEKSKLLSRLLKSKNPDDLQAANRLIKNMVRQDAERVEKVTRRTQQLETVSDNVKLLSEMLQNYQPGDSTESDREIMKELSENIEKQRPALFKLASDSDEKENSGIGEILKANDDVIQVLSLYDSLINQSDVGNLLAIDDGVNSATKQTPSSSSSGVPLATTKSQQQQKQLHSSILDVISDDVDVVDGSSSGASVAHSLLDEQLLSLGLLHSDTSNTATASATPATLPTNHSSFAAATTTTAAAATTAANSDLSELKDIFTLTSLNKNSPHMPTLLPTAASIPHQPPPYTPSMTSSTAAYNSNNNILQQLQQRYQSTTTAMNNNINIIPKASTTNNSNMYCSSSLASNKYQSNLFQSISSTSSSGGVAATTTTTAAASLSSLFNTSTIANATTATEGSAGILGSLDVLSKSLLQETLTSSGLKPFAAPIHPAKISLKELSSKNMTSSSTASTTSSSLLPSQQQSLSSSSSSSSLSSSTTTTPTTNAIKQTPFATPPPPSSQNATASTTSAATATTTTTTITENGDSKNRSDIISLDDVIFPLESFRPNKKPFIEVYNQNNVRITFHFSDLQPKPNVHVIAVTTTSTSPSVVKDFCFLATVSKPMRAKMQTGGSGGREFKAYNPILPPDVVTQLLFVGGPLQEPIKLKYKVSYTLDDDDIILDVGEVNLRSLMTI